MSKFYDTADQIAAYLGTIPFLSPVPIVVDRQKDIASELSKVVNKQCGCLVIVSWAGAPNEDKSADGPRFRSRYTVTLFSKPVIRKNDVPADDIIEAFAVALHDHRLTEGAPYSDRLVVDKVDPIEHDQFLIHRIDLSTPSQL